MAFGTEETPRGGEAGTEMTSPSWVKTRGFVLIVAFAVPLVGLGLLLAVPGADVHWEHHPTHFWLVLGTAALAASLGWTIGATARRRNDARLFLVSLAFLVAASFLGLHALATPGVLLERSNAGFVLATPIGLLLAALLAMWSATQLDGERARTVLVWSRALRWAVVGVVAAWAILSMVGIRPLDDPSPPETGSLGFLPVAIPGIVLYGLAAIRYLKLARCRGSQLALAVASAWVLLGEALVTVTLAQNWRATWWEWHLLMLVAFGLVAWTSSRLPEPERFGDLYLDEVAGATREISVLFADLGGFTTFAESHASDDVHAMLNAYFDVIVPAVVAEGGRIDRYIGDAVMVTFNVSSYQPDHARRAARGALALQHAAASVARAHPEWPRFRVGLNSGPATVGMLGGGGERDYTVVGDTVNLAARFQVLAPPGGVVVGAGTLHAVPGLGATPLGTVSVKGRRQPVAAWLLESADQS